MQKITPFLWFDDQAEEAVKFYVRSSRTRRSATSCATAKRARAEGQRDDRGLRTRRPGVHGAERRAAFQVHRGHLVRRELRDAEGSRRLLGEALAGGQTQQCGWLKDKFGLSWQIVPDRPDRDVEDKDPQKPERVMQP